MFFEAEFASRRKNATQSRILERGGDAENRYASATSVASKFRPGFRQVEPREKQKDAWMNVNVPQIFAAKTSGNSRTFPTVVFSVEMFAWWKCNEQIIVEIDLLLDLSTLALMKIVVSVVRWCRNNDMYEINCFMFYFLSFSLISRLIKYVAA